MLINDCPISEDVDLIARCRARDGAAWTALVQRYQKVVYGVALRAGLDADEAADVFQTVFLRLYQHLNGITEPARLRSWIIVTAQREAWLRRRRLERQAARGGDVLEDKADGDTQFMPFADGPEVSVAHWEQVAQVTQAFELLNERCQQLLRALFVDEVNGYGEVAERLNMPIGSIGPTRARCLARLREMVE